MSNSVTPKSLNIFVAEQVKESVSEAANAKIYITFGRQGEWANDAAPLQANTSVNAQREVWDAMIAGKRLTENDIAHVLPRSDWVANTSYASYDDRATNLYDQNFYIITSSYRVYKCLSNANNSISTVEPTSTNPLTVTQTADSYIWKFMYELNSEDKYRFLNDDYFPVRYLRTDNGSTQWDVQAGASEGSVYNIVIEDAGNYTNSNVTLTITGDGTSLNAFATVNTTSNTIGSVTIDDYGSGYTYADVAISGGGGTGGGSLRAIISPPHGHGANPLEELGGSSLMINARLRGSEDGLLPVTNELRQITLLRNPLKYATSNVYSNSIFSMTEDLTLNGVSSEYEEDEIVYQGTNLASSTYQGKVVKWDTGNSSITLNNTKGTPTSDVLTGDTTGSTSFVSSVGTVDLVKYSGSLLYIDNIPEINRNEFQTENFRIVLKF